MGTESCSYLGNCAAQPQTQQNYKRNHLVDAGIGFAFASAPTYVFLKDPISAEQLMSLKGDKFESKFESKFKDVDKAKSENIKNLIINGDVSNEETKKTLYENLENCIKDLGKKAPKEHSGAKALEFGLIGAAVFGIGSLIFGHNKSETKS